MLTKAKFTNSSNSSFSWLFSWSLSLEELIQLISEREFINRFNALGFFPTDRFEISENLSNSEILVIPIPEYESTPKDANSIYNKLLRVAQFRSAKEAEKLVKQLTTKDFPNVQLTNSTWYFVTVGPFESRSLLNKAQDIMAQMNYVPQVITLK